MYIDQTTTITTQHNTTQHTPSHFHKTTILPKISLFPMEAPPPPPVTADSPHSSLDSSTTTTAAQQQQQKLRLMCSYNGHIVPRPHDKSLCYIGGDTRIIVIDRSITSLSSLHDRLSKTLLNNQPFILKYQLPNEDLDSLISVATDEDLENMLEEYDRLMNTSSKNKGRLRLFLFPKLVGPGMEQMLVETASTKSDDWFLDALNGKRSNLSGGSDLGFSETSSVNCLLGLDDDFGTKNAITTVSKEVHSVPDSPMVPEATNSSFGSTSSSPSVVAGVNLAPIKVRVDDGNAKLGIEEQFQQQMTVGNAVNNGNLQKQEEVFVVTNVVPVGGEYANNRGFVTEDERLDHGGGGYRLVQQIQPQVQQVSVAQLKQQTSVYDLASPESVSSEGSARNPLSRQGQTIYQEPYIQMQPGSVPITVTQVDLKNGDQNIRNKVQMQQPQVQDSGYVLQQGHYDHSHPQLHHPQQQFIHPGTQYIPAGAVPITQYYQMYPPRQQSMHEHQYPVYFMPPRQPQTYNLPMQQQPNYGELPANAHSSQPQTPPSATITPTSGYTQGRVAPSSNPEMPAGVYRTGAPQYVGLPQYHHPSQSMVQSTAGNTPYANYEFADPVQGQIYYTHAMPPPQMAAQFQTMTSGPMIVPTEASAQLPAENMKQQVRAAQP